MAFYKESKEMTSAQWHVIRYSSGYLTTKEDERPRRSGIRALSPFQPVLLRSIIQNHQTHGSHSFCTTLPNPKCNGNQDPWRLDSSQFQVHERPVLRLTSILTKLDLGPAVLALEKTVRLKSVFPTWKGRISLMLGNKYRNFSGDTYRTQSRPS